MATMADGTHAKADRETLQRRLGWAATGLFVAFMAFDAIIKVIELPIVIETQAKLGWPADLSRPIGILELALVALYLNPRTAVLGAVMLTGLFGATVAAHIRIGSPLLTHALFGVYLATIAWAGICLRDKAVRRLLPLRRD